jgi:hypothetical protein
MWASHQARLADSKLQYNFNFEEGIGKSISKKLKNGGKGIPNLLRNLPLSVSRLSRLRRPVKQIVFLYIFTPLLSETERSQ